MAPKSSANEGGEIVKKEDGDDTQGLEHLASDEFAWERCGAESPAKRIQIKEQAVEVGFKACNEIARFMRKQLRDAESERNGEKDAKTTVDAAKEEFMINWLTVFDELKKDSIDHTISVGVVGGTGMGKTSLLNALLGINGLLSTSNKEASTAVHCILASSKHKRHRYTADIRFRNITDVRAQLRQGQETLQAWHQANEALESDQAEDVDMEGLKELEEDAKAYVEEVSLVWGPHTWQELIEKTVDDLLSPDDPRTKWLGKTRNFHGDDLQELAEKIEPYISTTPLEVAEDDFCQAAPLVDYVKIYCPSPLLDSGITLHDFPGLADNNVGRASIAERKLGEMDIVLVVGHVNRISDEATATQLMTDSFLTRLEMNGQHKSFGIVLSKIDDLGIDAGVAKVSSKNTAAEEAMKQFQVVDEKLKKSKRELEQLGKALAALDPKITALGKKTGKAAQKGQAEARAEKKKLFRKHVALKGAIEGQKEELAAKSTVLRGFQISARNRHVTNRLLTRHRSIAIERGLSKEELPGIFPTSSMAYWPHHTEADGEARDDELKPLPAFPSKNHSGIPALRRHIRDTAIPSRERHAMTMLNRLASLLMTLETWSRESDGNLIDFSKCEDMIEMMVAGLSERLTYRGENFNDGLFKGLQECHPLQKWKGRDPTQKCRMEAEYLVDQWIRKNPKAKSPRTDQLKHFDKIHVHTQAAIIRRAGARYVSKGATRIEHNWMDNMTEIFRTTIKKDWKRGLQIELPRLETTIREELEARLPEIVDFLGDWFEGFTKQHPEHRQYLMKSLRSFNSIQRAYADEIGNGLNDIATRAREASDELPVNVQQSWDRAWETCKTKITGKNQRNRRQEALIVFVNKNNTRIFKTNIATLYDTLDTHAADFKDTLPDRLTQLIDRYEKQLRLIMSKIVGTENDDGGDSSASDEMLKAVWSRVMKWQTDWRTPPVMGTIDADTEIPEPALPPTKNTTKTGEDEGDGSDVDMDAEKGEDGENPNAESA